MPCPLPRRTRQVRVSVAFPSARPSPKFRRVGVRDFTCEMLWGGRWRDVTIVAGSNAMERPMAQQLDDLSRSLTPLEQDRTIIAVIEMSQASWLVAGIVPGIERHPLKKLEPSEVELLRLFMRWRAEATQKGRTITRIVVAFEAGRDGVRCCATPWRAANSTPTVTCSTPGWAALSDDLELPRHPPQGGPPCPARGLLQRSGTAQGIQPTAGDVHRRRRRRIAGADRSARSPRLTVAL